MSETTALTIRSPLDLTENVKILQEKGYNVLLPMTTFASQNELFVPRLDIVIPDIAAGDFYKQGSKWTGKVNSKDTYIDLMAPSGLFLNKVATAANIQWHPDKTGVAERGDTFILYKAVAAVRQADGQWRVLTDEYELDLVVVEEELRMEYTKKAKTSDFQAKMKKDGMTLEDYVKRDLLQKRRHKVALAESGAMNRVIRKALNLRSTYPLDMAKNPFAIARFDFQPDYNDPTVRRYASIAAIQAQNDLYGQGTAIMPDDISQDEIQAAGNMMDVGNITKIDSQMVDLGTGEVTPPGQELIDITMDDFTMDEGVNCIDCGKELKPFTDNTKKEWSVQDTIDFSMGNCNRLLCIGCAVKDVKAQQKAAKEAGGK